MQVFLVPANPENIKSSITQPVPRPFLEKYFSSGHMRKINAAYKQNDPIYCWAMTESRRSRFNRMKAGDLVLLCVEGTGIFGYEGLVAWTCAIERDFGDALWPHIPNAPWTLVYFLTGLRQRNIDKQYLLKELGYKTRFWLPGTELADDKRLRSLLNRYGTIPEAFRALSCEA
jgi:hypothetical protein